VVIARSLNAEPKVLVLDDPTKGIDVGAKSEIYQLINEFAAQGIAIVMISSDLPELLNMCDRFIVMAEGRVAGELSKEEANNVSVMRLATKTFKKIGNSAKEA
jgi:ABC-type sugar transport system ATPase subunit